MEVRVRVRVRVCVKRIRIGAEEENDTILGVAVLVKMWSLVYHLLRH